MVRGLVIAVTAAPGTYQCAEMASIAFGEGLAVPKSAHALVYWLCSRVFIGLPCPMKTAGISEVSLSG